MFSMYLLGAGAVLVPLCGLASLGLGSLICKMGLITVLISLGCCEDYMS